jgi:hypothetical protein
MDDSKNGCKISRMALKYGLLVAYDDVINFLGSIVLVASLLLGVQFSAITSISESDLLTGDIKSLAIMSNAFRCHFFPNASLGICRGPFDKSVCNQSQRFCISDIYRDYAEGMCDKENILESLEMINKVDVNEFWHWVAMTQNSGRNIKMKITGLEINPKASANVFDFCLPSTVVSTHGFRCVFYNMSCIFLSLFLYISLILSGGKEDLDALVVWWISLGLVGTIVIFLCLIRGSYLFMMSIEYLLVIRYPFPEEVYLWKKTAMDEFSYYGLVLFPTYVASIGSILFFVRLCYCLIRAVRLRADANASSQEYFEEMCPTICGLSSDRPQLTQNGFFKRLSGNPELWQLFIDTLEISEKADKLAIMDELMKLRLVSKTMSESFGADRTV